MSKSLVLASASPRRTALLTQLGIAHQIQAADIDETPLDNELPMQIVTRLAAAKAAKVFHSLSSKLQPTTVVLAADTLIALGNDTLGKPEDEADFNAMMTRLSGSYHEVITALSVHSAEQQQTQAVVTKVEFAPMSQADISRYWQSGEPCDKAGGYAIQGLGGEFVVAIEGSYSSVVGLPLYETKQLLAATGVDV